MVVIKISINLFIKGLLMPRLRSFSLRAKLPSGTVGSCHPAAVFTISPEGTEHFSFQKLLSLHLQGQGEAPSHPLRSVVLHRDGDLVDKFIILHFAIWLNLCFPEKIVHCKKSH